MARCSAKVAALLVIARLVVESSGHQTAPAQQHRNWVARHPVLTAAMIGAGGGAAIGFAISDPDCEKPSAGCDMRGEAVPLLAILGAGFSALGVAVIRAVRK